MKISPMLYNTPMAKGLWEDRKHQTRRLFKNIEPVGDDRWHISNAYGGTVGVSTEDVPTVALDYTPHQKGDLIYVRESWQAIGEFDDTKPTAMERSTYIDYIASSGRCPARCVRPSIHMPRWASRMTLLITDVRVQRLQDIDDADALQEGIEYDTETAIGGCFYNGCQELFDSPRLAFRHLWDSLNEDRGFGWDANPWVTAYTFDVIKQNVDEYLEAMAP